MFDAAGCARAETGRSLPHPIAAVILFPTRQLAAAGLQEQPVVMIDQSAAAEIAQRQIDLAAGRATDILQGLTERTRCLLDIHPEHQRFVFRECRREGLATLSNNEPLVFGMNIEE